MTQKHPLVATCNISPTPDPASLDSHTQSSYSAVDSLDETQRDDKQEKSLDEETPPTDYRGIKRRTERALVVRAALVLVVIGGGLIWLIMGREQAIGALPCLLVGAAMLGGLYLLLRWAERWADR